MEGRHGEGEVDRIGRGLEEEKEVLNPTDKTWEDIGNFEGDDMWSGCAVLPDGRVLVPPQPREGLLARPQDDMLWCSRLHRLPLIPTEGCVLRQSGTSVSSSSSR